MVAIKWVEPCCVIGAGAEFSCEVRRKRLGRREARVAAVTSASQREFCERKEPRCSTARTRGPGNGPIGNGCNDALRVAKWTFVPIGKRTLRAGRYWTIARGGDERRPRQVPRLLRGPPQRLDLDEEVASGRR